MNYTHCHILMKIFLTHQSFSINFPKKLEWKTILYSKIYDSSEKQIPELSFIGHKHGQEKKFQFHTNFAHLHGTMR